jgi:hypothetical protein
MNRVPGLLMLLFIAGGTFAGIRYGADLTPTVRGIVGGLGALGAFWVLASLYYRLVAEPKK